ncbi:hypothetical protein [Paenibacillus sp. OV219]|uniref:hypothetical protein n=1 Tax=Paenibacillus sp. OV219 TaxID=1884377 RepID=UPI0008C0C25A|nr:hypothetical protein [Paenibacillus sp. OV219]SEM56189.1 hypothetical protein SAMN05518847_101162 [Paenibacillus sp. OV219]
MHAYYRYGHPYGAYRAPTTPDPSDVTQFKYSANQFMVPTLEMYHLLTQLSQSADLAKNIKEAASKSEHSKAVSLIQAAGVKSPFGLTYSPEGLILTFNPADQSACFSIRMSLCW